MGVLKMIVISSVNKTLLPFEGRSRRVHLGADVVTESFFGE